MLSSLQKLFIYYILISVNCQCGVKTVSNETTALLVQGSHAVLGVLNMAKRYMKY